MVTLDQFNLSVFEANIFTGPNGECFNRFVVLDADGNQIGDDKALWARLKKKLEEAMRDPALINSTRSRRLERRVRQLTRPTEVELVNPPSAGHSVLTIVASDRPGLLARIGLLFIKLGVSVTDARISTLGDRVEDSFHIVDSNGQPISNQQSIYELENHVRQELDRQAQND